MSSIAASTRLFRRLRFGLLGALLPVAIAVIEGEVRLDEGDTRPEGKFVVFVTLDRVGEAASRRQFLTEGTSAQMFEMAGYLTERIASHVGADVSDAVRARFGRGMTPNLAAFQ